MIVLLLLPAHLLQLNVLCCLNALPPPLEE